jgi:hypothetical protein
MWKRMTVMGLAAAVMVTILGAGLIFAQEGERDRGDRRGPPRDPEEMRRRFEEFRQRMSDRLREQLGATEDEWKILQPRIEKVTQLQRQGRGGFGMMRGMFGRGRGPGGRGGDDRERREGEQERERSDVEQKTEALRSLLEDENSSASSIKAALEALRQARAKSQEELATARKELRQVCSMKQEAQLVLMGILD